jgi:hypothetical protein
VYVAVSPNGSVTTVSVGFTGSSKENAHLSTAFGPVKLASPRHTLVTLPSASYSHAVSTLLLTPSVPSSSRSVRYPGWAASP